MVRKQQTVDDEREPMEQVTASIDSLFDLTNKLNNLSVSGVIQDIDINGVPVWRTGHLEHIANLFAGDPATTERDYADDLAVARAYCREQWEALIASQT